MATISKALNYKIVADTGDFQRDLKAAQRELKAAERAMLDTMTPAQKMETRIASLDRQLAEGKIKTDEYTKANERLRQSFARTQEIEAATKALERANKTRGERVADKVGALPIVGHLGGDIGKGVDLFTGGMGPMAAIGTVAGVATVAFKEFREESEKIDRLNKSALSMGFSTEAALVLQKQAKKVDVEFDAVAQSVRKMNKAIGEAKSGDAGKQDAFASLGLDAKKLGNMKPEEAFLQVSDALRQMTDPYQRATVGADIFGKESATLNEVLRMGAGAFNELRASMEANGQLFSSEQADQVERANKSYEKLGSTWRTLKQNLTIEAAPALTGLFDQMNKATGQTTGMMDRVGSLYKLSITAMTGGMAAPLFDWQDEPKANELPEDKPQEDPEIKQSREEAKKIEDEQRRTREQEQKTREQARAGLEQTIAGLRMQTGAQQMSAEAARIWAESQKAGNPALAEQAIELIRVRDHQKQVAEATKRAADETRRMGEEMMFANLPTREAAIALEKYRAIRDGANQKVAEDLAGIKLEKLAREELKKVLDDAQTPLDKYNARMRELTALQQKFPTFAKQLEGGKVKAGEELARSMGFDPKALRTPREEMQAELENLAKLKATGVLKDEQLAAAKQKAMKKYWDADKQPTGIEAMTADSQEFRLAQIGRFDEQIRFNQANQLADQMMAGENAGGIAGLPRGATLEPPQPPAFAPPTGWYEAMLAYTQQQATRQPSDPATVEVTAGRI